MPNALLEKISSLAMIITVSGVLFFANDTFIYSQGTQNGSAIKAETATRFGGVANTAKFAEYRGVHIGMGVDEARQKLGKAKAKDKAQDLYVFSETESAQVFFDDKQSVYAISIDYAGKNNSAPSPVDIFGHDVPPKPDGAIYQVQQYTDAGYWVSYNRTTGDSPLITVTIQKIPGSK